MTFDRVAIVEASLDAYLAQATPAPRALPGERPLREGSGLSARKALELFEDQLTSRQLDVAARELKKTNRSFYTISSAGHEDNVVIGAQLRINDPAFLHYRSGALMMARARQLPGSTPAFDALLGVVASGEDPIAQGRHKVWGSRELWVPPQTSTIASHMPKAMGLAFSLARARRLLVATDLPDLERTAVLDDLGVSTLDFDLTAAQKDGLVAKGEQCTCDYLAAWQRWHGEGRHPGARPLQPGERMTIVGGGRCGAVID